MIDYQRRFLIAHSNPAVRKYLAANIEKLISGSTCFFAENGIEANFKITNAVHNVVFLEGDLAKRSGFQLTEWLLDQRGDLDRVAIVIIAKVPEREQFVDAVVMGRVHFLENPSHDVELEKCITRALNYCFHGETDFFNLKFMARGEVLMKEGEKAENVYLLRKGEMRAVRQVNAKEVFLGKVEVGEFVGEMAYVNHEKRSADVIAETAVELIEIPISRIDHVLFQKPSWAKSLMRTLSKRLKSANEYKASNEG